MALHGKVYDLTRFLPNHPGGQSVILKYAGQDATLPFEPIHPADVLSRYLSADQCMGEFHDTAGASPRTKKEARMDEQVRLAREQMPRLDEMYNSFDFECKHIYLPLQLQWANPSLMVQRLRKLSSSLERGLTTLAALMMKYRCGRTTMPSIGFGCALGYW